jgi:dTDP-glucose pyrophosphorylase
MSYNWKNILIKPDQPISDALRLLDMESLRIAAVVDDDLTLLGVLTDGDVRRGLLKDYELGCSVKDVMNKVPLTAPLGTSRKELVKLMESNQLLAIPLLTGKTIAGLETLENFSKCSTHSNPVFIMAGGFGTRLSPLTDNCPKPMLTIGDRPLLEIVIAGFIKAGFKYFFISTHYMPEVIQEYFGDGSKLGVKISYVHEETPLGTGGALGLLPEVMPDLPMILVNGDVLTTLDLNKLLSFHNEHNAVATICVRNYDYQVPYGVINSDDNKIISMVEKPIQRFSVNAGVYVLSRKVARSVEPNVRIDMPTLLGKFVAGGEDIKTFSIYEYWLDIGEMDDYLRAQVDILGLDF